MKKSLKILTAAALLLAGLFVTGCGLKDELDNLFGDTYDTWYKYDGTLDLPLAKDEEEGSANKLQDLKGANVYLYYNTTNGLKVAVVSTVEQEVFGIPVTLPVGGTKEFPKDAKINDTTWLALVATGKVKKATDVGKDGPAISIDIFSAQLGNKDGEKGNFQWKTILKEIILGWLN